MTKRNTSPTLAPRVRALLAAALFGINAPLSKVLLGEVDPIAMAGFLYLGSGVGALLLLSVQRSGKETGLVEARLQRADLPWLAGALLAGGVAAPIVLMFSLRVTPAATASLLLNFEGVATTLIAALIFREAIGRRVWWAVGLVTAASMILSWEPGGRLGFSLGALGVLAACTFWGMDNNFTRNISAKNPLTIVMVKGLGAGLVSLVLTLLLGRPLPRLVTAFEAMALGSISYGLSIMLFILALRDLGAARTSALFSTAPFIGSAISFLIFLRLPGARFLAALPIMVIGTVLLVSEKHVHEHFHSRLEHEHRHGHDDSHHTHTHPPEEMPEDGEHVHHHEHEPQIHSHPHTPDLHHRHTHEDDED